MPTADMSVPLGMNSRKSFLRWGLSLPVFRQIHSRQSRFSVRRHNPVVRRALQKPTSMPR